MSTVARDLLRGAVDLHIHAAPDLLPRIMDDLELAGSAAEAGMAALMLKCHHMMTADRAQIAQKVHPQIKVFGGLALNLPACGGLNPEAVKVAIRMGAKEIWLPTLSSRHHVDSIKTTVTGNLGLMSAGFSQRPVAVLTEDGTVPPELAEIFSLIAEADILLGTGHISPAETMAVVDAALAAGVRKIVVTHPELPMIGMGVEDQRELASKGVMLERCIRNALVKSHGMSPGFIAEQIKAVGVESTVMATDLGQVDYPTPVAGMLWYIEQMLECGISPEDIETMVQMNPKRLLSI